MSEKKSDFSKACDRAVALMNETGKTHAVLGYRDEKTDELVIVKIVPYDEVAESTDLSKGELTVLMKSRSSYNEYVLVCQNANVDPMSKGEWLKNGMPTAAVAVVSQSRPAKTKTPRQPKSQSEIPTRPAKGSTKMVWDIADELSVSGKPAERKAIIDTCVERGVNKATAQVQYAAWKRATEAGTK